MNTPLRILVLCTGNSCRSQIAEGYFRALGKENVEVCSAGTEAHGLNPRAIQTMMEDGTDISTQQSETIEKYANTSFDVVLTVCDNARERCPYFPANAELLHQDFPDPAKTQGSEKEIQDAFRQVRDQIKHYVKTFLEDRKISKA